MVKERLCQLDALRFFAIFFIVLSHMDLLIKYTPDAISTHISNANWGVDYFFLLSGFGLFYSYNEKTSKNITIKNNVSFALKKIKRYYPLYIASLVLCIPYSLYYDLFDNSILISIVKLIAKFGWSATLLQTLSGLGATHYSLNSPAWFLSCMFITYMLVPVFLIVVSKIRAKNKEYVGALLVYVWIQIFSYILLLIESINIRGFHFNALWYSSAYIRCFYVLLGMIICTLYQKIKFSNRNILSILECSTVGGILLWFYFRNELLLGSVINRALDVLLAAISVFIFAYGKGVISGVLEKNILVKLGECSNYIFLLHWPLLTLEYIFALSKIEGEYPILSGILQSIFLAVSLWIVIMGINKLKLHRLTIK